MTHDLSYLANLYNSGKNTAEIAQSIGETVGAVYGLLEKAYNQGISVEPPKTSLLKKYQSKRAVYQYFRNNGYTVSKIAFFFEVTKRRVTSTLLGYCPDALNKKYAMHKENNEEIIPVIKNPIPKKIIQDDYLNKSISRSEKRKQQQIKNYFDVIQLYNAGLSEQDICKHLNLKIYIIKYAIKKAVKEGLITEKSHPRETSVTAKENPSQLKFYPKEIIDLNSKPGMEDKKVLLFYNSGIDIYKIAYLMNIDEEEIKNHINSKRKKGYWVRTMDQSPIIRSTAKKISSYKINFDENPIFQQGKENFYDIFTLKQKQPDTSWDKAIKIVANENNKFLESMFRACTVEYIKQPDCNLAEDPILTGGTILQKKLGWL
jgi:transposase